MMIKMIQVNIWKGKFLKELILFLRREDPDVITLQEVTSGASNFWRNKRVDLFAHLKRELGLNGVVAPLYHYADKQHCYTGNAIFTKGTILSHKVAWMIGRGEGVYTKHKRHDPVKVARNLLDATIALRGKTFHALSFHGAWTKEPVDTPRKIQQARNLVRYLKRLRRPFILGGDFNMPPTSRVIKILDKVAYNAVSHSSISRTTHPTIHVIAKTKPKGLIVDFIYTSPHFKVLKIDAPLVAVSDHLPVRALLSIT